MPRCADNFSPLTSEHRRNSSAAIIGHTFCINLLLLIISLFDFGGGGADLLSGDIDVDARTGKNELAR